MVKVASVTEMVFKDVLVTITVLVKSRVVVDDAVTLVVSALVSVVVLVKVRMESVVVESKTIKVLREVLVIVKLTTSKVVAVVVV